MYVYVCVHVYSIYQKRIVIISAHVFMCGIEFARVYKHIYIQARQAIELAGEHSGYAQYAKEHDDDYGEGSLYINQTIMHTLIHK